VPFVPGFIFVLRVVLKDDFMSMFMLQLIIFFIVKMFPIAIPSFLLINSRNVCI